MASNLCNLHFGSLSISVSSVFPLWIHSGNSQRECKRLTESRVPACQLARYGDDKRGHRFGRDGSVSPVNPRRRSGYQESGEISKSHVSLTRKSSAFKAVKRHSTDAAVGKEESENFEAKREIGKNGAKSMTVEGCIEAYASKAFAVGELLPPEGFVLLVSCFVGLMTGAGVVIFNLGVHKIHDVVWFGIPGSGSSWMEPHPLRENWLQVVLVPAGGGVLVGILNSVRSILEGSFEDMSGRKVGIDLWSYIKACCGTILKATAAVVTLGTGNSLGPEGPSVELGASIGAGIATVLRNSRERTLSLIAAGSSAGISSGFNAAVAGCFFAVESVLQSSLTDSPSSLTTAMVILSSVLASVVSQAGLGSDPAFKIPAYDFRSPAELPLYLLLGILCGLVSVALKKGCTYSASAFDALKRLIGIPAAFLPPLGGLCVGIIALQYPGILYWGFENVDVLLESRPFLKGPPAMLLLQLVGAKLIATSVCRGSGLVGGVYAPSLFIGAALGSAYGKLVGYAIIHTDPMYHLDVLKVAVPQAYALVGMAAMLAGVCQVPLTSVLLLFELTRDYRIILPLMGAVGLSSWIASAFIENKQSQISYKLSQAAYAVPPSGGSRKLGELRSQLVLPTTDSKILTTERIEHKSSGHGGKEDSSNSLCVNEHDTFQFYDSLYVSHEDQLIDEIPVSAAMRSNFVAVTLDTSVCDAVQLMHMKKEWCVILVSGNDVLEGILTLEDIQKGAKGAKRNGFEELDTLPVSSICCSWVTGKRGSSVVTVYPDVNLKSAQQLMAKRGLRQVPVVARNVHTNDKVVLGLLDRDLIQLACRAEATRKVLGLSRTSKDLDEASVHGDS